MPNLREEHIPILGVTIVGAVKTKDDKGYDIFHFSFSDGSGLLIREESQSGYLSYQVLAPGIG